MFEVLEKYGIPVARYKFVETLEEVLEFFRKIKKPIVLKAISKKIIHKTEAGAVRLNLDNEEKIKKAFEELREKFPDAKILAQEMIKGVEVFIGAKRDPIFGTVVSFGIGGIFVEVLKDISMRIWEFDKKEALEMINEIKGRVLLEGYRGGPKVNKEELADIILKVGKMMEKERFREIDLNPVICNENGCFVVDFRCLE